MTSLPENRISVLLDCISVPLFSKRIVAILCDHESEVMVEQLVLPFNRLLVFRLPWRLIKSRSEIVHYLWGYHHPLVYIFSKILGKKVMVHWIGTDVMLVSSEKRSFIYRRLRAIANKMIDMHLTVAEHLSDELESIGIKAEVLPFIPEMPKSMKGSIWPSKDRIHVYLPEDNVDFYGGKIVYHLVQELNNIEFLITGNCGKGLPQFPNVKYLGWVENMENVWKEVKIYLRLTKHDGLSNTVIEALARGKHVVWTYQFPYCYQGHTFEESKDAISKILTLNKPNIDGMYYVNSHFNPSKIIESLKQKYLEVLSI